MAATEPIDIPNHSAGDAANDSDGTGGFMLDGQDAPSLGSWPADNDVLVSPVLGPTTPGSSKLSRNPSFSDSSTYQDDWESFPPLDRISMLDILDNFALAQQLEKLQKGISKQTQKVRKGREAFRSKSQHARSRMVEEWRRRVPTADEQLDRYRKRMRHSVDKLGKQWNDTRIITLREKVSFICGVLNIFISGYLLAGYPEWFHIWYTVQLVYFMPIRIFSYHRRGMHYFLADLCYFVNLLLFLSMWVFPQSKRLFTAVFCLAFGNNAVAVIMWRNSLVFHSFDKVATVFIHIMPCATLHCVVHLWPDQLLMDRFPGIWAVKNSPAGSPTAYGNLFSMLAWSSLPYLFWQMSYYFLITVRRREKIAAGRPTSFTWLRRSYAKHWLGKFVLSLPDVLQEPAFMGIQGCYALLTMLPCPIWFYSKYASSIFLTVLFIWSIYNGSTFYIDVFGKRFQKELDTLKAEVSKWQNSPDLTVNSPLVTPNPDAPGVPSELVMSAATNATPELNADDVTPNGGVATGASASVESIPLLSEDLPTDTAASGIDGGARDVVRERKPAETART